MPDLARDLNTSKISLIAFLLVNKKKLFNTAIENVPCNIPAPPHLSPTHHGGYYYYYLNKDKEEPSIGLLALLDGTNSIAEIL